MKQKTFYYTDGQRRIGTLVVVEKNGVIFTKDGDLALAKSSLEDFMAMSATGWREVTDNVFEQREPTRHLLGYNAETNKVVAVFKNMQEADEYDSSEIRKGNSTTRFKSLLMYGDGSPESLIGKYVNELY